MNSEETEQLKILLNKFANEELDQWERFKIQTNNGVVFIQFSRNTIAEALLDWDDITLKPPKK